MNMVDAVPVEYYSPANLAVARNASANLGTYQKLQLITGRWESSRTPADHSEAVLENYEAAELARRQLNTLYNTGIYPTSLLSDYENWYGWETEFCKAVDATFHTYTAYYWKLSFVKYDGSEMHHVYMLEDGTIFLAEALLENGIGQNTVSKISQRNISLYAGSEKFEEESVPPETPDSEDLEEYLAFTDIDATDLNWLDISSWQADGGGRYYMLQAISENRCLFSLQPVDD